MTEALSSVASVLGDDSVWLDAGTFDVDAGSAKLCEELRLERV